MRGQCASQFTADKGACRAGSECRGEVRAAGTTGPRGKCQSRKGNRLVCRDVAKRVLISRGLAVGGYCRGAPIRNAGGHPRMSRIG